MDLALFTFVVRNQKITKIFKIIDVVYSAPKRKDNSFGLFIISRKANNMGFGVFNVGHIRKRGDIGADFARPTFYLFLRAVSNSSVVSIGYRLLFVICCIC